MSAKDSEKRPGVEDSPVTTPSREESTEHLTYEGTRVPWFVVLVWTLFIVWALSYLLRFLPASIREWFTG